MHKPPEKISTREEKILTPMITIYLYTKKIPLSFDLHTAKKNKKFLHKKIPKNFPRALRITPLYRATLICFFLLCPPSIDSVWSENTPSSSKKITCPQIFLAKKGSAQDEYLLARAYEKGHCQIPINEAQSVVWYTRAAEHGHMLAQYALGELYFTGTSTLSADYPKAKKFYLAAAAQGHGLSQLRLGFLYAEAHFKGLTTDYQEAEKWFLRAAEQNAGDAQFRLGNFYHNYKKPADIEKAIYWLTKASEGGHRVAMFDVARLLQKQNKPDAMLAWMKKSAALDFLPAQMALSNIYATGQYVPKNPIESLFWTLKIAESPASIPFWQNRAADILFEGRDGIAKDYTKAAHFYSLAARKEDPHALTRLGKIYLEGLGLPLDHEKAVSYLKRAAAKGSEEAKELLKGQTHVKPSPQ